MTSEEARDEVDRIARLLMAEWERVEGKSVSVSYVATFADMARVMVKDQAEWIAEAKAEALREAADNLYLNDPGQHNYHARTWLHRRANLIDPTTRDQACAHGFVTPVPCPYCESDSTFRPAAPSEGGGDDAR